MQAECYTCHPKTVQKLIQKFQPNDKISTGLKLAVKQLLQDKKDESNPYLATLIHRMARQMMNISDLYAAEKKQANSLLLKSYDTWKTRVIESNDPELTAAKLAVAGNIIDYGAHSVPDDIEAQLLAILQKEFAIDHSEELFRAIKKANYILYIGDNAGEIVMDKLFIETLGHKNITFAVRGFPVLNDVTETDTIQTGINKLCKIISNGYDAPSTLLSNCSVEFIETFKQADLIIAKGQGNFEGLMNSGHNNLFFMLMAKCQPIAEMLNVQKGDLIIAKASEIRN